MTLSDLDYVESLPECITYKDTDWKKLKEELCDYLEVRKTDGTTIRPLESMYDYFMQSDISYKMATHAVLFTLSASTTREQTINYRDGSLHLNFWGIIIGPSSLARKTATERKSKKLLGDAGIAILPGKFTTSALYPIMKRYGNGAMIGSEFSGLLKSFQKEHYNDLPELLCQIYDCEDQIVRFTRTFDEEPMEKPYITFYGGTTPFAYDLFLTDYFVQGFLMRFFYCLELKKTRYKSVSFSPDTISANRDIATELLVNINMSSVINIERGDDSTTSSFQEYIDYIDKLSRKMEENDRSILFSYYGRVAEFLLKIIGLLELARTSTLNYIYSNSTTLAGIQDDTLDLAVKIVRMFEQEFRTLVRKVRTSAISDPVKTDADGRSYVLNIIRNWGVISNPDLGEETHYNPNKLRPYVDGLLESHKIFSVSQPKTGKRGSPKTLFFINDSRHGQLYDENLPEGREALPAQILWLKQQEYYDLARGLEEELNNYRLGLRT